jgi:hypothetical protein
VLWMIVRRPQVWLCAEQQFDDRDVVVLREFASMRWQDLYDHILTNDDQVVGASQ